MDEAKRIFDYLPISFGNDSELDYIVSLQKAMNSNYANKHYQFSYLAFHMLFMAAIYYNILQIRAHSGGDYKKIIIGFQQLLELEDNYNKPAQGDAGKEFSPFSLSVENERKIFELLRFLDFDKAQIGNFKKLVDFRNDLSHCNGKASLNTEATVIKNVEDALKLVDSLQQATKKHIDAIYTQFLATPEEEWEYSDINAQVEEAFIKSFYLSREDIKFCKAFDINTLDPAIKPSAEKLHNLIVQSFQDDAA